MKNKTTIEVSKELRDEMMLFKIQSKAKNLEEVIGKAIKLLKKGQHKK